MVCGARGTISGELLAEYAWGSESDLTMTLVAMVQIAPFGHLERRVREPWDSGTEFVARANLFVLDLGRMHMARPSRSATYLPLRC
jgi:hypothetical protein